MTLSTEIPLWGIIALALTLIVPGIGILIKMWSNQREHRTQIGDLKKDQQSMRDIIEEKNERTLAHLKQLEQNFMTQEKTLIEIKTLLNLLIHNRIRHEDKS